jgi:hypothetical protein
MFDDIVYHWENVRSQLRGFVIPLIAAVVIGYLSVAGANKLNHTGAASPRKQMTVTTQAEGLQDAVQAEHMQELAARFSEIEPQAQ